METHKQKAKESPQGIQETFKCTLKREEMTHKDPHGTI